MIRQTGVAGKPVQSGEHCPPGKSFYFDTPANKWGRVQLICQREFSYAEISGKRLAVTVRAKGSCTLLILANVETDGVKTFFVLQRFELNGAYRIKVPV